MDFIEWLAFIFLGLIWGSSFLWIKIAVKEISPFLLVALRLLFALICFLLISIVSKPEWPKNRKIWISLTILGITNNGLPYLLISWGEQYIDSAVAAILNSTVPLFTMVIAHFFFHDEKISKYRLLALMIGFVGVITLVSKDINTGIPSSINGQLAVLFAAISYAVSSIYARKITQNVSPIPRALIPLIGADILLWLIAPIADASLRFPVLSLTWIAILWLGIIGVGIAYILYFYLLHAIGPTRTTLVSYIFPLVGVFLGVVFLSEDLNWNLLLGTVLIISSVILVNRKF